jgi:hypothetical protein
MEFPPLSKNIPSKGPLNRRSLGYPGFPVKVGGVGELHAPFLTERRIRDRVQRSVAGNPGTLGMTKGRAALSLNSGFVAERTAGPSTALRFGMTILFWVRGYWWLGRGVAGAKALVLLTFSARLKSCPDTKRVLLNLCSQR